MHPERHVHPSLQHSHSPADSAQIFINPQHKTKSTWQGGFKRATGLIKFVYFKNYGTRVDL